MSLLEEPYRSRAIPPGTVRYWSWLFAAQNAREPLLATYALTAEWRALTERTFDAGVAATKLLWWREEIGRLAMGTPVHPITRYMAQLPQAAAADFGQLDRALDGAQAELSGVPLARSAELDALAWAIHGIPLHVAAVLSLPAHAVSASAERSMAALASAQYLYDTLRSYRHDANRGRVCFPVDALLEAGIDNADLCVEPPPPRLAPYLAAVRAQAAAYFSKAQTTLAPPDGPPLRHLAVLATLGARRVNDRRDAAREDFHFADLYNAWNAARRAAAGR